MLEDNKFLEDFKTIYPDRVNEKNEVLVLSNNNIEEFVPFQPLLQELVLYSATFGKTLYNQNYKNIIIEKNIQTGRLDCCVNDLEDNVLVIIENGIFTTKSVSVKNIYKKLQQSLNYMYELSAKDKLSDKVFIQINLYNPETFLSNNTNFHRYSNNTGINYSEISKEFGLVNFTWYLDKKSLKKLLKMMDGKIHEEKIEKELQEFFSLDKIIASDYTLLYMEDIVVTQNSSPVISNNNYSVLSKVNHTSKVKNSIVFKIPYRTNNRFGSAFDNTRGIDKTKVEDIKNNIIKTCIQKIKIKNVDMDEILENIGWENKRIKGSEKNSAIYFSEKSTKVLAVSLDMVTNNGQHHTIAWYELLKLSESESEFKELIASFLSKNDTLELYMEEIAKILTNAIIRLDFNLYDNPKLGKIAGEINNNTNGQSSIDMSDFRHRETSRMIVSNFNKTTCIINGATMLLDIGISKSEDPKNNALPVNAEIVKISTLNNIINAIQKGREIKYNKKNKYSDDVNVLSIFYKDIEKEDLHSFVKNREIIKHTGKSKTFTRNFNGLFNYVLKENLQRAITSKNKIIDLLDNVLSNSEKYTDPEESKDYIHSMLPNIVKTLKPLSKTKELQKFVNIFSDQIDDAAFKLISDAHLKKLMDKLINGSVEVDTKKIEQILNILKIVEDYNNKQKVFTSVDTVETFVGLIIGFIGDKTKLTGLTKDVVLNILNNLSNTNVNIDVAAIRNTKINAVPEQMIHSLNDFIVDILKIVEDRIDSVNEEDITKLAA